MSRAFRKPPSGVASSFAKSAVRRTKKTALNIYQSLRNKVTGGIGPGRVRLSVEAQSKHQASTDQR